MNTYTSNFSICVLHRSTRFLGYNSPVTILHDIGWEAKVNPKSERSTQIGNSQQKAAIANRHAQGSHYSLYGISSQCNYTT